MTTPVETPHLPSLMGFPYASGEQLLIAIIDLTGDTADGEVVPTDDAGEEAKLQFGAESDAVSVLMPYDGPPDIAMPEDGDICLSIMRWPTGYPRLMVRYRDWVTGPGQRRNSPWVEIPTAEVSLDPVAAHSAIYHARRSHNG